MARFSFRLPDIGEGIAEAEIVAWHVAVGDRVEEDQNLADMMTDKATVEMESPVAGTVVELAGEVGDQVAIGSTLVVIETEGEGEGEADAVAAPPTPAQAETAEQYEAENPGLGEAVADAPAAVPTPPTVRAEPVEARADSATLAARPSTSSGRTGEEHKDAVVLASPAVRARARDLGVELSQIRVGEGERVRHADLDAFLRYGSGQGYQAPHSTRARPDEAVRVIGMRRRIAENMAAAKRIA